VDRECEPHAPYPFTGTVRQEVFDLAPEDHQTQVKLHERAMGHVVGQGAAG
jgi:arylsulfatase